MKKQNSSTNVAGITIALTFVLASSLFIVPSSEAANIWDGGSGTNSNWGTADNWDDNTVPAANQPLTFAGSTRLDPFNDTLSRQVNGFTFAALAGAFTLSGNAITLFGNITNSSANTQTINLDMATSAVRTIGLATSPATNAVTLGGVISGAGGFTTNSADNGTITLSGNNSFTGGVTINSNASITKTLNIGHANALGTGLLTLNGGANSNNRFDNTSGAAMTIANNISFTAAVRTATFVGTSDLTINGTTSLNANLPTGAIFNIQLNANTLTLADNVYLTAVSTAGGTLRTLGAGNLTISGVVSNYNGVGGTAGGIHQGGSGTLTLSNVANTYTGATTIGGVASVDATMIVTKLANGGVASSIGASSSAAANLSVAGTTATVGVLRYIGSGDSTDRLFGFPSGNSGTVLKIESSGSGALHFTNTGAYTSSNVGHTLELGGTYTGGPNTMAVALTQVGGTLAVRKDGAGTWNLTNNNDYTQVTTVNAGTLLVSGAGSINSTSGITVNGNGSRFSYTSSTGLSRNVTLATGGGFFHSGSTNYSGALTWTNGTLGGTNWNGSSLNNQTVSANRTISPGNSPGTAVTGNQTWGTSGSYIWEINNAAGTAGVDPGWDLVSGTGTLTISATSANPFTIDVTSLTLANISGDAVNFNAASNYVWRIADFASPISGFSIDKFAINTSSFTNTLNGGNFGVVLGGTSVTGGDDTQIYLTFTAIPEPSTTALLLGGLCVVVILLRRRPRTHKGPAPAI